MSFDRLVHFSYPPVLDHQDDPRIQQQLCRGDQQDKLHEILASFLPMEASVSTLRRLGDALAPDENFVTAANMVVDKVQRALHKCKQVHVDRCCVSGSFGKTTSVVGPFDIDLVVFLNEAFPPFDSTLTELTKFLTQELDGIQMEVETETTTRYSVQFILDGFHVDLLPASNLVPSKSATNPTALQRLAVWKKLGELCEEHRMEEMRPWSAALAESTVEFMKRQSSFAHAAVRVCKLWKKSCLVVHSSFSLWFTSSLIELIAIKLANDEERDNPNDSSIMKVFQNFLMALADVNRLSIILSDCYYEQSLVPDFMQQQRPLIMDPVNPYNNVASHIKQWETLRLLAQYSLKRMEDTQLTIQALFRPRLGNNIPSYFDWCSFQLRFALPLSFLRSVLIERVADLEGKHFYPTVEWRSINRLHLGSCEDYAKKTFANMFQSLAELSTNVLLHLVTMKSEKEIDGEKIAVDFLDDLTETIFNVRAPEWVPSDRTHEECDLTLRFGPVPLPSPQNDDLRYLALVFSFNIHDNRLYYLAHEISRDMQFRREEEQADDD